MNNPAMLMFNQGSGSGPFNINNFIRINTFTPGQSSAIDTALSNSSLIFSPPGWLYALNNGSHTVLYQNPLVSDVYENKYPKSYVINPKKFSKLIDEESTKYYVSPPDVANTNGGGWILYQDAGNIYHILYNPFNRTNFNYDINEYQSYCSAVNFSDPGCYCTNFPNQNEYPCIYDAAKSKTSGQALLSALENADRSSLSADSIQALDTLKSNKTCGCLSNLCTNWQSISKDLTAKIPSMNQIGLCQQDVSVNICASDVGGGQGTIQTTSSINVTQNCTPPGESGTSVDGAKALAKPNNTQILIIGGVIAVIVIILLIILLK